MRRAMLPALAMAICTLAGTIALPSGATTSSAAAVATQSNPQLSVSPSFCKQSLERVDELVSKEFWKADSVGAWKTALDANRRKILESKTLIELSSNINAALKSLHASHTQFVTTNDETYYFLQTMFHYFNRRDKGPLMDYTGPVTGGLDCKVNQVRYVLDGSPAQAAGMLPGDLILQVDGADYVGQSSFSGKSGKEVRLKIRRPTENTAREITIKPVRANDYDQYLSATEKSVSVQDEGGKRIGYIRVWCGGEPEHDIIEEQIAGSKLQNTDALIFDMRDGYGGNYYDDLDVFYRPAIGYVPFKTQGRKGSQPSTAMAYDKPLVALINAGSRSGKELLAYNLKQTHRATLVGERTAGYVLGGRLFNINEKCALYLAVQGPQPNSLNLEGIGVEPDITVAQPCDTRGKMDLAKQEAIKVLLKQK